MGSLLLSLIPPALGIVLSPLAVLAVIAVLLSERARLNSLAFLIGRVTGITVAVAGGYLVLRALDVQARPQQALWLVLLHFVLALVLLVGAGYVLLRGRQRGREMAAARTPAEVAEAAPQLPGWLQSVDRFTPAADHRTGPGTVPAQSHRCVVRGDRRADHRAVRHLHEAQVAVIAVFIAVGSISVVIPVLILQIRGDAAKDSLNGAGMDCR